MFSNPMEVTVAYATQFKIVFRKYRFTALNYATSVTLSHVKRDLRDLRYPPKVCFKLKLLLRTIRWPS